VCACARARVCARACVCVRVCGRAGACLCVRACECPCSARVRDLVCACAHVCFVCACACSSAPICRARVRLRLRAAHVLCSLVRHPPPGPPVSPTRAPPPHRSGPGRTPNRRSLRAIARPRARRAPCAWLRLPIARGSVRAHAATWLGRRGRCVRDGERRDSAVRRPDVAAEPVVQREPCARSLTAPETRSEASRRSGGADRTASRAASGPMGCQWGASQGRGGEAG
jgi:hypothetical protein